MNFRAQQDSNKRMTIGLLVGMAVLLSVFIYAVLTYFGTFTTGIVVPIAIGVALISVWISYYGADKLVIKMTGARIIEESEHPKLFNLIQEITIASGLPMPKVAIVEDDAPNAFATGRDSEHALIAFTTGMLEAMDRDQLQGVIAHELAHIANRDTLVSAVAATTAGAIAILSDIAGRMIWAGGGRRKSNSNSNPYVLIIALVVIMLAPLAAGLLRTAISRKRESLADATAVAFTRNPTGLRRALEVLATDSTVVRQKSTSVAHLWIESPLDGKLSSKLFSTHPPISERIAILKAMEQVA